MSVLTVADLSDLAELVTAPGAQGWYQGGYSGGYAPEGPSSTRYLAGGSAPYDLDGVARLRIVYGGETVGCSGTLVTPRHLLTAAHCVTYEDTRATPSDVTASFWDRSPSSPLRTEIPVSRVLVHPGYTGDVVARHDIAVLELSRPADPWIPTYGLFNGNPLFQETVLAGYGASGNGVTGGVVRDPFYDPVLRYGLSSWELTRDSDFFYAGYGPGTPVLVSDFDGATPAGCFPVYGDCWPAATLADNNTICGIFAGAGLPPDLAGELCHTGYGLAEVSLGPGDSGGPGFIVQDGLLRVAAVASFSTARCSPSQVDPGACVRNVGYFGGLAGHVSVAEASNSAFIRQAVVPEPTSALLILTGLVVLAGVGVRGRRQARGTEDRA